MGVRRKVTDTSAWCNRGQHMVEHPENLELWSVSQPSGQRVADKVAWAKEILALYEPDALRR